MKNNLKKLRKELRLDMRSLSAVSGVSIGSISELENEKRVPTPYLMGLIAQALECTVQEVWPV